MDLLAAYPWPGNVRELRNVLERALLLAQGKPLAAEHFSSLTVAGWSLMSSSAPPAAPPAAPTMRAAAAAQAFAGDRALLDGSTAGWILDALKKAPNGLTRSEISGLFARHRPAEEIARALTALAERSLIGLDRTKTAGRPVERWFALESDPR
jgi:DNA-binding NtrC family response regulator